MTERQPLFVELALGAGLLPAARDCHGDGAAFTESVTLWPLLQPTPSLSLVWVRQRAPSLAPRGSGESTAAPTAASTAVPCAILRRKPPWTIDLIDALPLVR